ncbi:DUF423 domain-containing protein [Roseibium marinum]|uniref:Uncharacterized membrane protein YgdD (TMEM256/DUF423 family) n=1 Tax=Roseibium marinum TaxID=281252 RepID=A0A2S3UNF7_9HYPH|nr:DUF423 domain-containing protein [Roseibium marinum]POF29235.1 uncharacterized membrane protein YgdD (TMEM256/DUF423 family) [Roseibium marinum]
MKALRYESQSNPEGPTVVLLRLGLVLSGLSGALGVASLALSAHAAASALLETAAQMLLLHAPVFLGLGVLAQIRKVLFLPLVVLLMTAGLTLFCGDMFSRIILEQRLFSMSAPIGGMLVILGWLVLALSALRVRPK